LSFGDVLNYMHVCAIGWCNGSWCAQKLLYCQTRSFTNNKPGHTPFFRYDVVVNNDNLANVKVTTAIQDTSTEI